MSIFLRNALGMQQHARALVGNTTASDMASQWANPSDITAVVMIIGGDVVQKALAQTTGCWFTPVCFSFGWVAYSFMSLVEVLGDGRLLPSPDVPCKVINLTSGYGRDNRSWVIGRLVRDIGAYMSREKPSKAKSIRISVWKAKTNKNQYTKHSYWSIHIWGVAVMILQLAIASIPLSLYRDWGVLFITGSGTILSLVTGALPQWTAEKLPNKQTAKGPYAITAGNGSKDIIVILGDSRCLDLEEMSTSESPRNPRLWEKFKSKDTIESTGATGPLEPLKRRTLSQLLASEPRRGMSTGFCITFVFCVVQTFLWLALLISVSALQANTWYILIVGGVGMFQNAFLAAMEVKPELRNLPLELIETIATRKVMDGIMDLEAGYGCGKQLRQEFFPGELREDERKWWEGNTASYDEERTSNKAWRGPPRTRNNMPNYKPQLITAESEEQSVGKPERRSEADGDTRPSTSTHKRPNPPSREHYGVEKFDQQSRNEGLATKSSTLPSELSPWPWLSRRQSIHEQKRRFSPLSNVSPGSPSQSQKHESSKDFVTISPVENSLEGGQNELTSTGRDLASSADWA